MEQQQLQTETLTEHPLKNAYGFLNNICYELSSLQDLACRGSWKSILDKVSRARTQALLSKPHEHLVYSTFNTLGLMKLRRFSDTVKEIDTLEDGIDNLRSRVGDRQESVDRFYMLLDYVREKMRMKTSGSDDIWRKREGLVINSIISHHLSHKEFGVCLELIKDLMKHDETAVGRTVLMSKLGYIQMQLGDLEGAKASFNVVEEIVNEEKMQFEMKNLVNRNKALMFMVGKDYVSAVREYQECIDRDATDVVLEKASESVPTAALNETLVVNLCSMYELAYVNHTDTKKTLVIGLLVWLLMILIVRVLEFEVLRFILSGSVYEYAKTLFSSGPMGWHVCEDQLSERSIKQEYLYLFCQCKGADLYFVHTI
ncbi:hypothetical protein Tco_1426596 [Tanacetum coccineum]